MEVTTTTITTTEGSPRNKRQLHEEGDCDCVEHERRLGIFKKKHKKNSSSDAEGEGNKDVVGLKKQIETLKERVEIAKAEANVLKEQLELHKNATSAEQQPVFSADESRARIRAVVRQFMTSNPQSRTGFMPTCVEEAIYSNALCMAVRILEDVASTSSIDFLGHRMTFHLASKPPPPPPSQ
jgi:hypothetical protein